MKLFYSFIFIGIFVIGEGNALCEEWIFPSGKFLLKISRSDFSFDDEVTKRYFFCSKFKNGMINEKGLLIESTFLASKDENRQVQFKKFLDTCNKESGQSKEDTTWNIFKCIQDQREQIDYPPGFEEVDMKCINETGVSRRLTWKLVHLDPNEEDESLKKFMYCSFKNNLDDKGNILEHNFKRHKCNNGTLITDHESMWILWKCLTQQSN